MSSELEVSRGRIRPRELQHHRKFCYSVDLPASSLSCARSGAVGARETWSAEYTGDIGAFRYPSLQFESTANDKKRNTRPKSAASDFEVRWRRSEPWGGARSAARNRGGGREDTSERTGESDGVGVYESDISRLDIRMAAGERAGTESALTPLPAVHWLLSG